MEVLELRPAGTPVEMEAQTGRVMSAYIAAQKARASRRFLWVAVPVITATLLVAEAAAGLLARGSILAQVSLSTVVAAAVAVGEWRAGRHLRVLVQSSRGEPGG